MVKVSEEGKLVTVRGSSNEDALMNILHQAIMQVRRRVDSADDGGITITDLSKDLGKIVSIVCRIHDTYRQGLATFKDVSSFIAKYAPLLSSLIVLQSEIRDRIEEVLVSGVALDLSDSLDVLKNLIDGDLKYVGLHIKGKGVEVGFVEEMRQLLSTVPLSAAPVRDKVPLLDIDSTSPAPYDEAVVIEVAPGGVKDMLKGNAGGLEKSGSDF